MSCLGRGGGWLGVGGGFTHQENAQSLGWEAGYGRMKTGARELGAPLGGSKKISWCHLTKETL